MKSNSDYKTWREQVDARREKNATEQRERGSFKENTFIATFDGWNNIKEEWANWDGPDKLELIGEKEPRCRYKVPNYFENRNALVPVINKLSKEQQSEFVEYLIDILVIDRKTIAVSDESGMAKDWAARKESLLTIATAPVVAQATALLCVLGYEDAN